jgi:hypothetical protein
MYFLPEISPLLGTDYLFSTTTYKSKNQQFCAFCHMSLEGRFLDYRNLSYFSHICSCSLALEEQKVKESYPI